MPQPYPPYTQQMLLQQTPLSLTPKTTSLTYSISSIPSRQKRSYRERTCALGKSVLVTYVR